MDEYHYTCTSMWITQPNIRLAKPPLGKILNFKCWELDGPPSRWIQRADFDKSRVPSIYDSYVSMFDNRFQSEKALGGTLPH